MQNANTVETAHITVPDDLGEEAIETLLRTERDKNNPKIRFVSHPGAFRYSPSTAVFY